MTYEVLHRWTVGGWEFRCPLLLGVSGGARTYAASCAAAEHAVRIHLSVSLEVARSHVRHIHEPVCSLSHVRM